MEVQEEKLRSALKGEPGMERDNQLVLALADAGALLEDEPFAEWAPGPRERFEWVDRKAAWHWPETEPGARDGHSQRGSLKPGKTACPTTQLLRRPRPR